MSAGRSGTCYRCARVLEADDYRRGELCRGCGSETRCCRNCEHHSPALNNQCREPQSEPVADKEKSNFCEFFRPRAAGLASAAEDRALKSKTAFESLFREKPR